MRYKISLLIASGFFSGFSPKAPGTVGTIAAVLFWYAGSCLFTGLDLIYNLIFFALTSSLGILATKEVLKKQQKKDPQFIVIDEWAGIGAALLSSSAANPSNIIAAFILFRFFDISKPGIISKSEKLPGEYGIMLDDIISGFFSLIIIILLQLLNILPL